LTYIDSQDGVSNIWSQPLNGGKPVQVTNFKTGRIFNFAWSRDGKQLALARGTLTNDVILISDFRSAKDYPSEFPAVAFTFNTSVQSVNLQTKFTPLLESVVKKHQPSRS